MKRRISDLTHQLNDAAHQLGKGCSRRAVAWFWFGEIMGVVSVFALPVLLLFIAEGWQ